MVGLPLGPTLGATVARKIDEIVFDYTSMFKTSTTTELSNRSDMFFAFDVVHIKVK